MVEMENSGTSPGPPSPVLGGNGQGPLVKSLSHTSEEPGGYFTKKDGRKKIEKRQLVDSEALTNQWAEKVWEPK